MTNKLVLVLSPWALWLNVAEPMVGRPYGQPAFALRVEPASSLAANALQSGAVR